MKKQQSLKGRTASRKKCARKQPDVKRRGELGEAAFLHKASTLGFGVAKPWGDSDRYDVVVDTAGRLFKVQVKSAHCVSASPGGGYNIRAHGHRRKSYTAREIDFLVAYIVPEDIWYVFPPRAFKKMKSLRLFPHRKQKISKFERYREAWRLFQEVK
jgi:PD-(D/E)XK endonuclease